MIRVSVHFVAGPAANALRSIALAAGVLLCLLVSPAAWAQICPGEWLQGFGVAGVNSSVAKSVVWTPPGAPPSVVFAGSFTIAGEIKSNYVAAWDGTTWRAIGQNLAGAATALASNNGDLYVATGKSVYMLNDGAWQILGSATDGIVRDLLWSDGALYAGGEFTSLGGVAVRSRVARWNGTVWTNVGEIPSGSVQILGHYNGQLIAGGSLVGPGLQGARVVARWDGTHWMPLGTNPNGVVRAFLNDGADLIVAGTFSIPGVVNTTNVARWNGTAWSAIGSGIDTRVYALASDASGIILAGQRAGAASAGPYRWNGTNWTTMASEPLGVSTEIYSLCAFQGRVFVSGSMQSAGSLVCTNIAAWDGAEWSPLGTAGFSASVLALAEYRGTLVAGGTFSFLGQEPIDCVAILDGETWRPLGAGLTSVSAFCVDKGELFATGRSENGSFYCFWWSGYDWVPLGGPFSLNGSLPTLNALTAFDGRIIVGGKFDFADDTSASHVAAWNGFRWESLGSGVRSSPNYDCIFAEINALAVYEGSLFVGGSFDIAGSVQAELIARWDGTNWFAVAEGLYGVRCTAKVNALAVHEGQLVATGDFLRAGAQTVSYGIARWDGAQWHAFSPSIPPSDTKISLLSWNHNLYAGTILTSTYPSRQRIFVWNGSQWAQLGPGIIDGQVAALAARGDILYVGGAFRTAGDLVSVFLARWHVPQSCCPSDLNSDLLVDDADFQLFAAAYDTLECASPEMPPACPSDLNRDGAVDDLDFLLFVAAYESLTCS